AALADFQSAKSLYTQLAGLIDCIARGSGGDVLRQQLQRKVQNGTETFASADFETLLQKLITAEPYCSCCPNCYLAHPGWNHPDCKMCRGRGWTTRADFEACPESYRQQLLRLRSRS